MSPRRFEDPGIHDFSRGKRGAVIPVPPGKTRVDTLRRVLREELRGAG